MIAKKSQVTLPLMFAALLGCCIMTAHSALAATAEGCDANVEKAHQARAEVRTAYDVDVTEEHIEKPDSTMSTTCFNNLAGIDASGSSGGGGTIFSGDFISQSPSGNPGGLRADIQDSLQTFYTGFMDAMGADSGLVDYTQTTLTNNATCSETQDLWTQVKQAGVEQGVPNATLTDLLNGTMPAGANTDYTQDWTTEQGTDSNFSNYQTAITNPAIQPYTPTIPQLDSFCQAQIDAGVPGGACP